MILHKSFKLSESTEELILGPHEENPYLPREIINEVHIIAGTLH